MDPDMEATMVTDLFKIETTKELKNSTDYHAKALELGLVRVHMQGYRDGMYDEAIEATNKAIKELYGGAEENGTTPLVLFPDDIESKHREYDWYMDEQEGQLMGSDAYLRYGGGATRACGLA